jgi:hypothetical protein
MSDILVMSNKEDTMEITTTHENLVEKLKAKLEANLVATLADKDLTDEEKAAQIVLAQRKINNDANAITNLVFEVLA